MARAKTLSLIALYLLMFVSANLFVKHFGSYGLWFSSLFLIPFDFTVRAYFNEKYSKWTLLTLLLTLSLVSAFVTMWLNLSALQIAYASVCAMVSAQIMSTIVYQGIKKTGNWFYKVNLSDLCAILIDSFVFQYVAFDHINPLITLGQVVIKFIGGLLWYYILFKRIKIQQWITNRT